VTAKREFYTTNEIAQILGLSPFTVRRYIQSRKLKAVKLEGSYRVRRSHLNLFIQSREIETVEELAALENEEPTETPRKIVRPIEKKRTPRPTTREPKRKSPSRARMAVRRKEEK
jgi:excisionase family DNA binding protein